jgi:hypothetical protein
MAAAFSLLWALYSLCALAVFVYVVHTAFEGELSVAEAIVCVSVYLGFGGAAAWASGTPFGLALLCVAVGAAVGYPLFRWTRDRMILQQMVLEDLQKHLQTIEARPTIPYAYGKVGDIYFQREQWDMALAYYEKHDALEHADTMKFRIRRCKENMERLGMSPSKAAAFPDAASAKPAAKPGATATGPSDDKAAARAVTARQYYISRPTPTPGPAEEDRHNGSNDQA